MFLYVVAAATAAAAAGAVVVAAVAHFLHMLSIVSNLNTV